MKKIAVLLLTVTLISISCKKDETPDPVPPVADKYMNYNSGSEWNIEAIMNASTTPVTSTYKLTSSNRDSTINSKAYHVYTSSAGPNEYYFNSNNDYYTYRTISPGLGGGSVELLYLKDNAAVGTEWTQTFAITASGIPLNATLTNKIEERGGTKTVNGIEYKDVIKVKTTIAVTTSIPVTFTLVTDVFKFYAPKVGPIIEKTKLDLSSGGADLYNFEEDKKLLSSVLK